MLIPVQDNLTMVRDSESGAILLTDVPGKAAFMRQKKLPQQLDSMEGRISNLESSLGDIKLLLEQLVNK